MSLSDPRPYTASPLVGNAVSYNFTASNVDTSTGIKCIEEVFSSTSDMATVPPAGMVTTGATINVAGTDWATGVSGWTLDRSSNGKLVLHTSGSAATPSSAGPDHVKFDNIRNSTIADTGIFVSFKTYDADQSAGAGSDCGGTLVNTVTVQYVLTEGSQLSLTVDGALTFTVAGVTTGGANDCGSNLTTTTSATSNTIPFATVLPGAGNEKVACQTLTVGTNATHGFTVYIRDTGQLANALGQTIPDNATTNGSPGAFNLVTPGGGANEGSYAYTTDDGTLGTPTTTRFAGGPKYAAYNHTTNEEIAYESTPTTSAAGVYHVGHKVGITSLTDPGVYTTTVVYTCTPVY